MGDAGTALSVNDVKHVVRRTGFGAHPKDQAKLLRRLGSNPTRGTLADHLLAAKPLLERVRPPAQIRRERYRPRLEARMLRIGGGVQGGVYGNHPNIAPLALSTDGNTPCSQASDDPFRSIDFRDVYGSVLEQWLDVPHAGVLGLLPVDTQGPSSDYWTAENFDLALFSP